MFDRTPVGVNELNCFLDKWQLRNVNRPLLALKAMHGIEVTDTETLQLLDKTGTKLGRPDKTPFKLLNLTTDEYQKVFRTLPKSYTILSNKTTELV